MARATDDMLPESDAQQGAPHPRANVDFIGQAAAVKVEANDLELI